MPAAVATAAQHRRQETELVNLMEQAKINVDVESLLESTKTPKLYRPARPCVSGMTLPPPTKGVLVCRRYHRRYQQ